MLKEARERGLVEVSIHYPSRFSLELERRLEAELGLREAVVVNSGGSAHGQALNSVAGAASDTCCGCSGRATCSACPGARR